MPKAGTTITVTFHEGDTVIYQHAVKDFPDGMLEQFQERVFELFPNDRHAPAKFLAEAVASMCETGERTILINGIPAEYHEAAREVAEQAETTLERLLIYSINAAAQDKLHIVRLVKTGEKETESRVLILTGIPEPSWSYFTAAAEKIAAQLGKEFSPENVVGAMFENFGKAQLTINEDTTGTSGGTASAAKTKKRTRMAEH